MFYSSPCLNRLPACDPPPFHCLAYQPVSTRLLFPFLNRTPLTIDGCCTTVIPSISYTTDHSYQNLSVPLLIYTVHIVLVSLPTGHLPFTVILSSNAVSQLPTLDRSTAYIPPHSSSWNV